MSNITANLTNERVELIKKHLRRFNASKLTIPSSETNEFNRELWTEERESSSVSENRSANQVNEVKPQGKEPSPLFANFAVLSSLESQADNRQEKTPNSESPSVKMHKNHYYNESNKRTSVQSPKTSTKNAEHRQHYSTKDTVKVNDCKNDKVNDNTTSSTSSANDVANSKNSKYRSNYNEEREEANDNYSDCKTESASRKNVADSLRAFMRAVAQVESSTQHHTNRTTRKRTFHNTINNSGSDKQRQSEQEGEQEERHHGKLNSSTANEQNESFSHMTEEQMSERQKESYYYEQQIKNAENILKQLREMTYQTEQNAQEPNEIHLNMTNNNNNEREKDNVKVRATEEVDEHERINTDQLFSNFEQANRGRVKLERNKGKVHEQTFDKPKENCKEPQTNEKKHFNIYTENTAHIHHNTDHHNSSFSTSHSSSASTSSLSSSNAFTSDDPFSDLTSLNSESLSTLTSSQSSSQMSNSLKEMQPINTEINVAPTKATMLDTKRRNTKTKLSSLSSHSSSSEVSEPSTSPMSTSLPSSFLPTQLQENNMEQSQSQASSNKFEQSSEWQQEEEQEHPEISRKGKLETEELINQQTEKEKEQQKEVNKANIVKTEIKQCSIKNEETNQDENQNNKTNANFPTEYKFAEHFDLLMEKLAKLTESTSKDTTNDISNNYKKNNTNNDDISNTNNGKSTNEPAEHFSVQYADLFNQLEVAEMNIAHAHESVERFARSMHTKSPARSLPRVEQMQSLLEHREALLKEETLLRNESAPDGMTLPEIHQVHCEPFQKCLRALLELYANTSLKLKTILARRDAVEAKRALWQERQHDLHERQGASKIIEREIEEIESELQTRRNALRERQASYELRLHEHSDRDQSIQRHIDGVEELGGTISTWLHILEDRDVQLRRKEEKLARVRADLDRRIEDIQICKNVAKKYRQHSLSSPLSSSENNNRAASISKKNIEIVNDNNL